MQPRESQPSAPPPNYPAPAAAQPMYAPPAAPAPRRRRGPLFAIIAIVLVLVIAGGGYVVGGFVYAQGRIDSATKSYNSVIEHQNKLADFFSNLNKQISGLDLKNATKDTVATSKSLYQQLVSQLQSAEPQIASDDTSLAAADAQLNNNQWLTALSSSSLDKESAKIGYLRSALGVAKTITHDYIDYGNFEVAFMDTLNDRIAVNDAGNANDLNAVKAAVASLKTDVAKAIQLDHAPGNSPDVDTYLHIVESIASDFSALLAAVDAGDQNAVTQAAAALNADSAKLDAFDYSSIDKAANDFYGNLIDQYNKYIDQANKA